MRLSPPKPHLPVFIHFCACALLLVCAGCMSPPTRPGDAAPWTRNYLEQTSGEVTVRLSILNEKETQVCFGLPLQQAGIQPVWVQITNASDHVYLLLPGYTDPQYFSAAEVARHFRRAFASQSNQRQLLMIKDRMLDEYVPPQASSSGFLYITLNEASHSLPVALLSTGRVQRYSFFFEGSRLYADHRQLDSTNLLLVATLLVESDEALRKALAGLPACTTDAKGVHQGDPVNFFVVGAWNVLLPSLIAAGWDETEWLCPTVAWRTMQAFLLGSSYRNSPVSPLYFFGRKQDASFQKIRKSIHVRNHLRLWLTPIRYQGQPVWAGQISRDIGVRTTTHTAWLMTHEIDPDVDDARWALAQDLLREQCLARLGFVKGGDPTTPESPRHNLTGDIYFTDGLRAVFFLADTPTGADEIEFLPWENPPRSVVSTP